MQNKPGNVTIYRFEFIYFDIAFSTMMIELTITRSG